MTFQSIEELIDPSRNMRKYRKSLANAKPPVVPFFGKFKITFIKSMHTILTKIIIIIFFFYSKIIIIAIFLKDLTFIIEGNSTRLSPSHLRSTSSIPTTISDSGESSPNTPTFSSFSQNSFNSSSSSTQLLSSNLIPSPLSSPTIPQQPLINFEKFRFLSKNILNIRRYTSEPYSFANQLSGPPKILSTTCSLFGQNDLINTYNSLLINDLNGSGDNDNGVGGSNNNNNININGGGNKLAPLDHIGEVIERRMFAAAGSIFGGNVASIAMLDGGELEAELMTLSLEAEPTVNVI